MFNQNSHLSGLVLNKKLLSLKVFRRSPLEPYADLLFPETRNVCAVCINPTNLVAKLLARSSSCTQGLAVRQTACLVSSGFRANTGQKSTDQIWLYLQSPAAMALTKLLNEGLKEDEEIIEVEEPKNWEETSTSLKASLIAEASNGAQACPSCRKVAQVLLVHLGGTKTILEVHLATL